MDPLHMTFQDYEVYLHVRCNVVLKRRQFKITLHVLGTLIQWFSGALFRGIRWPRREDD
jgi:hypothetical protein